ncbi:uncharacterized protein HD556DRAFT_1233474, partial [Suillus plorans]
PHFRPLAVAFLQGAHNTWVRFCAEFIAGGTIDRSTDVQWQTTYMKTTNDDNEGALGTVRTSLRRAPHMALSHFNSRFMYRKNKTGTYIKNSLDACSQHKLCRKARERDKSSDEGVRQVVQVEYDKEVVQKHREEDIKKYARRDAAVAKLDAVVPRLTLEEVSKLRSAEVDLQIHWHRRFNTAMPAAKNMPSTKAKKVEVLMEAVGRYLRGEATPSGQATYPQRLALSVQEIVLLGEGDS